MDDKKLIKKLESVIIKTLKKEGGASGLKPLKKAIEKLDKPKKFNLVNFLSKMKNVKKHTNSDYILTPINENSLTKLDIKNLIKESIKEIKEQAYGSATHTTGGAPRTRAIASAGKDPYTGRVEYPYTVGAKTKNGMMEQEEIDIISSAEEMFGVAAKEHFGKIHLYPTKKPGDIVNYRTDKYYVIIKDDLKTITNISGPNNQTFLTLGQSLKFEKSELGQFAGVVSFSGEDTIDDPKGIIYILNMVDASVNQEAKNQSAFYTREPGTGGTGIDEDSIRINMEQAPAGEGGEGEGQDQKEVPVEEAEPAFSPKEIGECKAKCLDMDIENFKIQRKNVLAKLRDIQKKGMDLKPSELKSQTEAKRELKVALKDIKKQIKEVEKQQEQLKNPEKKQTNESTNKKNMKSNIKQLWDLYATDRLSQNSTLKEHMVDHKKAARRKILMEGVMNTFFEYFNQGHTNEEIVQLYAGKGVNVPESFVKTARNNFEAQTKLNAELEMSELKFKNEASQIVNNPVTGEADMLDDDKQLASGLFNEQDETPTAPEKEASDVSALNDEMKNINTEEEFTSVLKKLLGRADSISGMSETKIKALLMKSIKEL